MLLGIRYILAASCVVALGLGDLLNSGNCFDFSAFNIKVLGPTKMGKPDVVNSLVKILLQYDMSVIQEIRNSDQTAFPQLFDAVKNASLPCIAQKLAYFVGPRAGRSSSKEQYGFIYRKDKFTLLNRTTYPDDVLDIFEREPDIAKFQLNGCSNDTADFKFLVIVCHVKPRDAPKEVDALINVTDWAVAKYGVENVILTGDLNADCGYMNNGERAASVLLNSQRFKNLFGDDVDTTVSSTDCAYDRMFLDGEDMELSLSNVNPPSVDRFDLTQGLNSTQAGEVSDHYPIRATFCCNYYC